MVLRFAGPNVIVDVGKTEAIMPPSEQIPAERYHLNQRLTVYLVEITEGLRGEELIVSRSNNGLLEGLFKREVPEVAQGSVEIKIIAREAGSRSKIAVYSGQSGIDPVGSCVGQKGVRVQAIIQEFGGLEKIDIIQWQEDPKDFIAQALSPAKNVRVELSEEEKTAHVFVLVEELSLAIGRDGQNVRLASKLTGYRIEIEGEEVVSQTGSSSSADDTQTVIAKDSDNSSSSLSESRQPKAEEKTIAGKQSTLNSSDESQAPSLSKSKKVEENKKEVPADEPKS